MLRPRAWEGGTQVAQEGAEMKATWRPSAVHAEGTLVTADSRHLALSVSLRLNWQSTGQQRWPFRGVSVSEEVKTGMSWRLRRTELS